MKVPTPTEQRNARDGQWPALLAAAASVAQGPNIAATPAATETATVRT